jgi:enoyl-CoA hydratase/carnithine racemase
LKGHALNSTNVIPSMLLENDGHVATITLNRPAQHNTWNAEMELSLRRLMRVCADDDAVRVIVLTAAGKSFCAGLDMAALQAVMGGDESAARAPQGEGYIPGGGDFERRYSYLLNIPKPVLCGLNGVAAGVGVVLSLYCDVRYASSSAKLAAVFGKRGLVAEHGIAWMLPRLIGLPRAMEWLLSARVMGAAEAQRIGLVAEVFDDALFHESLHERAQSMARDVSPRSTRIIKRQLYEAFSQSLAEATEIAEAEVAASLRTADFKEGVQHFVEKRQARFTGR